MKAMLTLAVIAVQALLCCCSSLAVEERAGAYCDSSSAEWSDCKIKIRATHNMLHVTTMTNVHIICYTTENCIQSYYSLFMHNVEVTTTKEKGTFLYLKAGADLMAEKLTVTGFHAPGGTTNYYSLENGAAIYTDGGGNNILLNDCTFTDNSAAQFGGALSFKDVTLVMKKCTFERNHAPYGGGGIALTNSAATISHVTFKGCTSPQEGERIKKAHAGGAIYLKNADVTIRKSNFEHNFAAWEGGAIVMYKSDVTIWRSNFTDNLAEAVAALAINDCKVTLTDSNFINNEGTVYGGAIGIWYDSSTVTMKGNTFKGNKGKGADYYCEAVSEGKIFVTQTPPISDADTWDEGSFCHTNRVP